MTRIQNVKIGDPMGFKLNISDDIDLDAIVNSLTVYHGGKYIIGKDTSFIEIPHYHIHFFSQKVVSANALKVFRTTLKNKFPWLTKSDKFYTGQDLESADPDRWIAYCIKEEFIKSEGIEVTEKLRILSKSAFENKRQNKCYSEQKAKAEKEKKDFKQKMLAYVKLNLPTYEIPTIFQQKGLGEGDKIKLLVTKFLMENSKEGCLVKYLIDRYTMYCNIHVNGWDEFSVFGNLYGFNM